jgi:hypothetical protein
MAKMRSLDSAEQVLAGLQSWSASSSMSVEAASYVSFAFEIRGHRDMLDAFLTISDGKWGQSS